MEYFNQYTEACEGFWNYCEAENEETEYPNIEGPVHITTGSSDIKQVYLRMINSLLTFSHTAEDPYFRGYAEIKYYSLVESTWIQKGTKWYEMELYAGKVAQCCLLFFDKDAYDRWFSYLKRICIIRGATIKPIDVLGSGAFAKVYKTSDGYAAKVIDKNRVKEMGISNHIKMEIDIHRSLDHPNIVKLHEVHETDKQIILVLELVEGHELYQKCKLKLGEDDTRKIMEQILSAVAYLHKKYIMHLDIKPENIMVTKQNQIKLLDMGIARKFVWSSEVRCGTAGYIAPEIIR